MAKQVKLLSNEPKFSESLPNVSAAAVGDLIVVVNAALKLDVNAARAILNAINAHMPSGVVAEAFSISRNADGSADVSYRGHRRLAPSGLLAAVKNGLAHGIAGEVVDV